MFKESLNKTKPHFKNFETVQVIAEVESKDEVSTQVDPKLPQDQLAVSKSRASSQSHSKVSSKHSKSPSKVSSPQKP